MFVFLLPKLNPFVFEEYDFDRLLLESEKIVHSRLHFLIIGV